MTKQIELATPDTPDTAPTTEVWDALEDTYRHDKKARMVTLPTFEGDLADWRSIWRRFQNYVGKLRHITDDEQLCYLQDWLKDPTAQDIVVNSIRNGYSFEEVGKRLQRKYDQPILIHAQYTYHPHRCSSMFVFVFVIVICFHTWLVLLFLLLSLTLLLVCNLTQTVTGEFHWKYCQ